ncbi:MAG TPA: hypothetical protein PKO42_01030, partial [Tenuifilaceae bacterium]|nr:hypothetical protein [Tenuifilaceae bacterium]
RSPFEAKIFENQAAVEAEALRLYRKNPESAQEYLTGYTNGLMSDVTAMFLDLRNQIITNYTNNHE